MFDVNNPGIKPLNPQAKTLSLTFAVGSWEIAEQLMSQLNGEFQNIGIIHAAPTPGQDNHITYQVDVLDKLMWVEALGVLSKYISIVPPYPEGLQMYIDLRSVRLYGNVSDEEQFLMEKLVAFTSESRSTILGSFTKLAGLEQQVATLSDKVKSLAIYNAEIVNSSSLLQALIRLADKANVDIEDIFPTTFHRTH